MNNDIFDKYQDLGAANFGRQRNDFLGRSGVDPKVIGYSLLGLSVFLLTVSISLIGVANPGAVKMADVAVSEAVTDNMLTIELPFGTRARASCMSTCPADESGVGCRGRCNRLVVSEFARRILPVDLDPEQIARETAQKCRASKLGEKRLSPEVWRNEARVNIAALRALRVVEPTFDSRVATDGLREVALIRSKNFGSTGKSESEAAQQFAAEACLLEGVFAAQIALVHVANSNDTFSERFYRRFERAMREALGIASEETRVALHRTGIKLGGE